MGVAEPKALRNLVRVDEFTLPQAAHPQPRAGEREDECLVDATWLRSAIAGNEDLLARAGTARGQSKPDGLGILAVIIIIDGAIQFFDLEHDFEVVAMNDDPLNGAPNQFTDVCAPDAGREVGGLTVSRLLSTHRLDDNSLHFIGTDAWSETGLAAPQVRLADVVAIAISKPHRIGRRHPVAAVVEDETGEKCAALDLCVPALGEIAREPGLHDVPEFLIYDRLVLAPIGDALVHDFSPVDAVAQQMIERAAAEGAAAEHPTGA